MHVVAVGVADPLVLDVVWALPEALEENGLVAERVLRFAARGGQLVVELRILRDEPHALAAAARHRLDEQREADLLRFAAKELRVLVLAVITRDDGNAGFFHDHLGTILQSHPLDRFRRWPDEDEACFL